MAINFFNNLFVNKGYIEIDDGGLTNQRGIISYGVNGKIGQTTSWTPDTGGAPGLWVEGSNDGESGGIFMNGNTCALWSPGDQGILKIYDEDNFSQGPVYQITGTGISEGNRFASIFDTAYYLDPDGDSQLNTIDIDDYIRHRGDTNTYIGFPSNDTFIVTTASSERMRIDSAGAVSVYNDFTINNGSPEMYFQTGATHYRWMVAAQENVDAALEITPSTTTGGSTYSTPVAVFKATGNVGIGTTSPSTKLQVNGGYLRVDNSGGTDNYYLEFYESGAQRFRIYENNNNVYFDGGPGNTHFRPRQGGGSKNFIVTGANVGIGTSSPSRNLVVQGGGSSYLSIASGATSGSHLLMGSSFDDDEAWIQYNNNTNSMNFKVNGLFDVLVLNSDGSIQQANSSATGQYAAAFGQNNTANSLDAFATGENTTASGRQSFSGGFNTTASGSGSFAHGATTLASGTNSFAAGAETEATQPGAAAFNNQTNATGINSFATGGNTTASGEASFSGGVSSTAHGLASVVFGLSCNSYQSGSISGGTVSSALQYSMAWGDNANATGISSQAFGYITTAAASYSMAAGFNNITGANASAIFGQQNNFNSSCIRTFGSGFLNTMQSADSAVFGSYNGFTWNLSTTASNQFMLGKYLNVPRAGSNGAASDSCTIVGKHNKYTNMGGEAFVVGTGAGVGTEANSFTVRYDGNVLMEQIVNKNYSSDTAAAAGGVPIGGIYHNAGDLKIRLT